MSCALLDLHIQIVQSNLVQSVADFHNRDLSFVALSPVFGDRPSCSSSFLVDEARVHGVLEN